MYVDTSAKQRSLLEKRQATLRIFASTNFTICVPYKYAFHVGISYLQSTRYRCYILVLACLNSTGIDNLVCSAGAELKLKIKITDLDPSSCLAKALSRLSSSSLSDRASLDNETCCSRAATVARDLGG